MPVMATRHADVYFAPKITSCPSLMRHDTRYAPVKCVTGVKRAIVAREICTSASPVEFYIDPTSHRHAHWRSRSGTRPESRGICEGSRGSWELGPIGRWVGGDIFQVPCNVPTLDDRLHADVSCRALSPSLRPWAPHPTLALY